MKRAGSQGSCWLVALLLGAMTAWLYWPVQRFEFVNFDDPEYVTGHEIVNRGLQLETVRWALTHPHASNWHPLTTLSHAADVSMFRLNPAGHHLVNLGLHVVNSVLVLAMLRVWTGSVWRSALVAVLFAWHPMHVESVAWISERKDVLSTLFFLLTLLAYARYAAATRGPAWGAAKTQGPKSKVAYGFALLFFALGLMSKAMLVTLPGVLLLLDLWPLRRVAPNTYEWSRKILGPLLREKIPFLLLTMVACVITLQVQRDAGALSEVPFTERFGRVFIGYAGYVSKLLVPLNLAVLYPLPREIPWWKIAGAAVGLFAISLVVLRAVRRAPELFTGWFWFVGMLVPVCGLVQVGQQLLADRYSYIPSIGFFILLVWGGSALMTRLKLPRWVAVVGCAVWLATLGWLTKNQLGTWQDSETLYRHALRVTENNHVIHNNLAAVLLEQGRAAEAIEQLHAALRLRPAARPAYQLGLAESVRGNSTDAIAAFRQALALRPEWPDALNDLAWTLATVPEAGLRQPAEAVALAERACALTTHRVARYLGTLDAAYAANGQFESAINTALRVQELAQTAGDTNLAAFAGERLQLYRTGQPFYQSSAPNRP